MAPVAAGRRPDRFRHDGRRHRPHPVRPSCDRRARATALRGDPMRYTPVELRHVRMGRALFGYRRDDTDRMLEDVADSFEEVWCERGELADKLEDITKQLSDIKEREALLANTLISAEKAAAEAKELARKESELALSEAHHEARSVMRAAL